MIRMLSIAIFLLLLPCAFVGAQSVDTAFSGTTNLPAKVFDHIGTNAASTNTRITSQTEKYLGQMASKESQLQQEVAKKDSIAAKTIFAGTAQKYQAMIAALKTPSASAGLPALKEYLPVQDSLGTALKFLGANGSCIVGLTTAKLNAIQGATTQLQQLQGKWQQARDAEAFMKQREQQLTQQLSGYGMGKSLIGLNKTAFYFQQQMVEYKALLQDRDKLQAKVMSSVQNSTAFQHFMQKNSYLGRLFTLPDNYGTTATLPGLQTKDLIQQRLGLGNSTGQTTGVGGDAGQFLQQKVDNGQQQISQLKNKLQSLGNFSGGGDVVTPQFTPNSQKVKSLFKRLVYSVNLQTLQSSTYMPATVDLALMVGYQFSDKVTAGVGGSYDIGLGQGITHLSYSGLGAGFRSYVDIKARGSLWLTGGLEYNYVQAFRGWQDMRDWDQWQKSALFGLTKKFKLSRTKTSNIQLLFDALYKEHIPPTSPLLFRVGYSFN